MSNANSTTAVGFTGGQLAVGLSATVQLPAMANQVGLFLQYNAGQTMFIAGFSSAVFGQGFLWGQTTMPVMNYGDYRGSLYFTAGGATAVINWGAYLGIHT